MARRSVALRPNLSIGLPFSVAVIDPLKNPFQKTAVAVSATVPRHNLKIAGGNITTIYISAAD